MRLTTDTRFLGGLLGLCLYVGSGLAVAAQVMPEPERRATVILVEAPTEPEGYRMGSYRAPTPATLEGAKVISTEQAQRLHEFGSVIFVDVLPRPPKPKNLPEGTLWRDRPRRNIPGSVWLANVGFGALNPESEAYYRDNLERLTEGDNSAPMVIYCQANCWMSWNAAKRALAYGYSRVYWYPDGTDGWQAAGGDLEDSTPVPMPSPH